jgi:hypothetical protein
VAAPIEAGPTLPALRSDRYLLRTAGEEFPEAVGIMPEPDGIGVRPHLKVRRQRAGLDPKSTLCFGRGRMDRAIVAPAEDVNALVLNQASAYLRPIMGAEERDQRAGATHLFGQPTLGCKRGTLPWTRMAAASVRPEPGGMVLRRGAPLQKQLSALVPDDYRNRPVPQSPAVRIQFLGRADGPTFKIDNFDPFHGYQPNSTVGDMGRSGAH